MKNRENCHPVDELCLMLIREVSTKPSCLTSLSVGQPSNHERGEQMCSTTVQYWSLIDLRAAKWGSSLWGSEGHNQAQLSDIEVYVLGNASLLDVYMKRKMGSKKGSALRNSFNALSTNSFLC